MSLQRDTRAIAFCIFSAALLRVVPQWRVSLGMGGSSDLASSGDLALGLCLEGAGAQAKGLTASGTPGDPACLSRWEGGRGLRPQCGGGAGRRGARVAAGGRAGCRGHGSGFVDGTGGGD